MAEPSKDVLQPVDDEARRLAKGLIRSARFAALATRDPVDGTPAASRVIVATDMEGRLGFLISRLSAHFGALEAEPACSLLVGEPAKGDPLAHPRITILGRARKLEAGSERDALRTRFLRKHPKSELYVDFGDFAFWVLEPSRASLNGGYGKAYEVAADDIATGGPALDDLQALETEAIDHMHEDHADAIDRYAAGIGATGTGWSMTSLDPEGFDLVRGDVTARVWFDAPLKSASELRPALIKLARP